MKRLLLIAFALSFSSLVKANEFDSYVGLGVGQATIETDYTITIGATDYEVDEEANPAVLYAKAGGYLMSNFGMEARLAFGLAGYGDKYEVEVDGVSGEADVKAEVDSLLGLYATYRGGVGTGSSFYALFGATFGAATLRDDDTGTKLDSREVTSWSYGVGVNLQGFNIEYMNYLHEEDYDLTAINIGYMIQF